METVAWSWGDMPYDIGHLILDRLPEVVEHIRFGAVCEQWYFISKEYHQEELLKSRKDVLPMLLVPSPDIPAGRDPPRLYALSYLGKNYSNLQLQLPDNSNRYNRYCGSSYGWIAFHNQINGTVTLVYPFGREVVPIQLPSLNHRITANQGVEVHKIFVLPGSTPNDYAVLAIYGGTRELATIKSGEKFWVYIRPLLEADPASFFSDIVFYQGHVYAVSKICMIVKVDIQARPPIVKIMHPQQNPEESSQTYLVESISSDLFLLQRLYDNRYNYLSTIGFNIYMVKLEEENGQLIHMKDSKDLNGDTFFVGDNTSMAIQSNGCMPNSIYFTDDVNNQGYHIRIGPIDIGYYNVKDGAIGHCYKANPADQSVSRPCWIVPHQHIH